MVIPASRSLLKAGLIVLYMYIGLVVWGGPTPPLGPAGYARAIVLKGASIDGPLERLIRLLSSPSVSSGLQVRAEYDAAGHFVVSSSRIH